MGRQYIGIDVFNASLERLVNLYGEGHRVVCSFSAGKDSGICLELAIIAARETGNLPVQVVMRDEEIMLPGTFEYAERIAARPEVDFDWVYACQPIVNAFNRHEPYWFTFDPELQPEEWVRQPPAFARRIRELNIQALVTPEKYPPPEGKDLFVLIGLRAKESRNRMFGLYSSGGWLTKKDPKWGYRKARPIYDWDDGDVWKAIQENGWDYNTAYDVLHRFGLPRRELRIAPPTLQSASLKILQYASRAWPQWFDRCASRVPGLGSAAQYGRVAVEPHRKRGEDWEECYHRTCILEAPEWIAARAKRTLEITLKRHAAHSTDPLPQASLCPRCPNMSSWEQLAKALYMGDPFSLKAKFLPECEPEQFRPGWGTWSGGSPTW